MRLAEIHPNPIEPANIKERRDNLAWHDPPPLRTPWYADPETQPYLSGKRSLIAQSPELMNRLLDDCTSLDFLSRGVGFHNQAISTLSRAICSTDRPSRIYIRLMIAIDGDMVPLRDKKPDQLLK